MKINNKFEKSIMVATNISKTAFILQTTLSIAKSYLGLYRSIEGALQSMSNNINETDSSWNTSVNNSSETYYTLVTDALRQNNSLVILLQNYLSNQTTSENEFIYREPVLLQLNITNNAILKILELWKNIMALSISDNISTNEGKFQNYPMEDQKKHLQNKLFFANSIQSTLTTITVLFGTVDKEEDTILSNLHVFLFETFINNAHMLYTNIIESTDELETLIHNQMIYGKLITSFNSEKYVNTSKLICLSFEKFQESIENILKELSK